MVVGLQVVLGACRKPLLAFCFANMALMNGNAYAQRPPYVAQLMNFAQCVLGFSVGEDGTLELRLRVPDAAYEALYEDLKSTAQAGYPVPVSGRRGRSFEDTVIVKACTELTPKEMALYVCGLTHIANLSDGAKGHADAMRTALQKLPGKRKQRLLCACALVLGFYFRYAGVQDTGRVRSVVRKR